MALEPSGHSHLLRGIMQELLGQLLLLMKVTWLTVLELLARYQLALLFTFVDDSNFIVDWELGFYSLKSLL